MATLIRRGCISNETWRLLDAAGLEDQAPIPPVQADARTAGVLIPLALWLAHAERWASAGGNFGVLLQADDDPQRLTSDLQRIPVVAVHFTRFADGRGYSIARLLRQRYGYRGELRAVGEVLRDQLFYLKRVGFDAFELRADQDAQAALSAFEDFSESYQGAADQALPLFRRRCA